MPRDGDDIRIRLGLDGGDKVRADLIKLGADGQKALNDLKAASAGPRGPMLALASAADEVGGSVSGMADRLGVVGRVLSAMGPAGKAVAVVLGTVGGVLGAAAVAGDELNQRMTRLDTVLRATGHAAGLTSAEILAMAKDMEGATLVDKKQVLEASTLLSSYRSVAGDTFTRTIRLAQDAAAVFGGDLIGQTQRLAEALTDPANALSGLEEVAVFFTDAEKKMITEMVRAGNTAQAQRTILDALEQKVGGAGAGEAAGLTGATHRLTAAWSALLVELDKTTGARGAAGGVIDFLTGRLNTASAVLLPSISEQVVAKNKQLSDEIKELERLQSALNVAKSTPFGNVLIAKQEYTQQSGVVAGLRLEVEDLIDRARSEAEQYARDQDIAKAGARAAQVSVLLKQTSEWTKQLDDQRATMVDSTAEKLRAIETKLTEDVAVIEGLRGQLSELGGDTRGIDTLLAKRKELATLERAEATRADREAAQRDSERAAQIEERRTEKIRGVVEALGLEIDAMAMNGRQTAVQNELKKAGIDQSNLIITTSGALIGVYEQEAATVAELAVKSYDLREARMAAAAALQNDQTPEQRYADRLDELGRMLPALTLETQKLAVARGVAMTQAQAQGAAETVIAKERLRAAQQLRTEQDEQILQSGTFAEGWGVAFRQTAQNAESAAKIGYDAFQMFSDGSRKAIADMVYEGQVGLGGLLDMVRRAMADIVAARITAGLVNPALNGAIGALTGWLGSPGAGAGSVASLGSGTKLGTAPMVFAQGGYISGAGGPRADLIPARLSNGEFVVNAAATAQNRSLLEHINRPGYALGGYVSSPIPRFAAGGPVGAQPAGRSGAESATLNLNLIVNAPASSPQPEVKQRQTDNGFELELMLDRMVSGLVGRPQSATHQALKASFGLSMPLTRR